MATRCGRKLYTRQEAVDIIFQDSDRDGNEIQIDNDDIQDSDYDDNIDRTNSETAEIESDSGLFTFSQRDLIEIPWKYILAMFHNEYKQFADRTDTWCIHN